MPQFTEDDVQLAERYAAALQAINELQKDSEWTENDVQTAENYLHTLQAIKEAKDAE